MTGWVVLDHELRRIGRRPPLVYDDRIVETHETARDSVGEILFDLPWAKVFDFCERLYAHLPVAVEFFDEWGNELSEEVSREEAKAYIATELERIFLEDNLGYTFREGRVVRRGRSNTRKQVSKVEPLLGDPRLTQARDHYTKALKYFEHPQSPDFENVVKEAVCAVEAAARSLFPDIKGKTLGEVVKRLQGTSNGQLPKPIADTVNGLYAFRNAGDGVSHGGADGGKATRYIAEYALAIAASQVVLLQELSVAADNKDVPF